MNFAKRLRTVFCIEHHWWLLLLVLIFGEERKGILAYLHLASMGAAILFRKNNNQILKNRDTHNLIRARHIPKFNYLSHVVLKLTLIFLLINKLLNERNVLFFVLLNIDRSSPP